jgi:hypothetical protein
MGKQRKVIRRSWKQLWCVAQSSRERIPESGWNRLEMNAIGSTWGRERVLMPGVGAGVEDWSTTIVAELTR